MNESETSNRIEDHQILAYLDGEIDPETAAKIEASKMYRERARQLAELQNRLTKRLYRLNCPDASDLGEYHLGMLSQERFDEVEAHLGECPHCRRELAQLREFLGDVEAESKPSLLGEVKVLVARLISDTARGLSPGPALTPAYGIRGEEEGTPIYAAGGVQIALDVQEDPQNPGKKTLLGLVTGLESDEVEVQLYSQGEEVSTTGIDDLDTFIFSNLSPGTYDLILRGPELEIHINSYQI